MMILLPSWFIFWYTSLGLKKKKMQLYHNRDWNPLGFYVQISVTHDIHHILRGAKGAEVENKKIKKNWLPNNTMYKAEQFFGWQQ